MDNVQNWDNYINIQILKILWFVVLYSFVDG
jgi:hypothetical protein